jgi:hypothetical protein
MANPFHTGLQPHHGDSQAQNAAGPGPSADPELSMFLRKLGEQQALTYTIDKRNQMLEAGTKAVSDWEPCATGVNALAAPKALNASLASLKETLLQDAPSDLARTEAAKDLDSHIDSFMERGGMVARDGFKNYVLQTNNDWLTKLLSIAAGSGGDPATQQWAGHRQGLLDRPGARRAGHDPRTGGPGRYVLRDGRGQGLFAWPDDQPGPAK